MNPHHGNPQEWPRPTPPTGWAGWHAPTHPHGFQLPFGQQYFPDPHYFMTASQSLPLMQGFLPPQPPRQSGMGIPWWYLWFGYNQLGTTAIPMSPETPIPTIIQICLKFFRESRGQTFSQETQTSPLQSGASTPRRGAAVDSQVTLGSMAVPRFSALPVTKSEPLQEVKKEFKEAVISQPVAVIPAATQPCQQLDPGPPEDPGEPESPPPAPADPSPGVSPLPRFLKRIKKRRNAKYFIRKLRHAKNPLDKVLDGVDLDDTLTVTYLSGTGIFGMVDKRGGAKLSQATLWHLEQLERKKIDRIANNFRSNWEGHRALTMHVFLRKQMSGQLHAGGKAFILKQMEYSGLGLSALSAK